MEIDEIGPDPQYPSRFCWRPGMSCGKVKRVPEAAAAGTEAEPKLKTDIKVKRDAGRFFETRP